MKTIFVFCFCVASAFAGVQDWTREAEENYLSLYKKYCSGSSSAGNDGDVEWHCKSPKETPTPIKKTHTHKLDLPSSSKQQLVFIETPSDEYQHEILVTGDLKTNQDTKIVVVPSADKHNYDVKDNVQVDSKAGKPSIFYLKSNPNESGQSNGHRSLDNFGSAPNTRFSRSHIDLESPNPAPRPSTFFNFQ